MPLIKASQIETEIGKRCVKLKTRGEYSLISYNIDSQDVQLGFPVWFAVVRRISKLPNGNYTWERGYYFMDDIDAALKFIQIKGMEPPAGTEDPNMRNELPQDYHVRGGDVK